MFNRKPQKRPRLEGGVTSGDVLGRWIRAQRGICMGDKSMDRRICTHLLMGKDPRYKGSLCVDTDMEKEYLEAYGNTIPTPSQNYSFFPWSISEQRTEVFRYFCDLDIKSNSEIDDDEILKITECIRDVVEEFYPGNLDPNQFDMVVCRPLQPVELHSKIVQNKMDDVEDEKDPSVIYKYGVHPIFVNIFVSAEQALALRAAIIFELERMKTSLVSILVNEWEDIVDECVYTTNGLRMLGSVKFRKCERCSRGCDYCDSRKLVDPPYYIWDFVSDKHPNKERDDEWVQYKNRLDTNIHATLKCTSIRYHGEKTDGYEMPSRYRCLPHGVDRVTKLQLPGQQRQVTLWKEDAEGIRYKRNKEIIAPSNKRYLIVSDILKEYVLFNHKDVFITRIMYIHSRDPCIIINVGGPGSQYCSNLRGEHRSNSIYFLINKRGICQRCYCKCNTTKGRVSGKKCQDYASDVHPVPPQDLASLFEIEQNESPSSLFKRFIRTRSLMMYDESKRSTTRTLMGILADKLEVEIREGRKKYGRNVFCK